MILFFNHRAKRISELTLAILIYKWHLHLNVQRHSVQRHQLVIVRIPAALFSFLERNLLLGDIFF